MHARNSVYSRKQNGYQGTGHGQRNQYANVGEDQFFDEVSPITVRQGRQSRLTEVADDSYEPAQHSRYAGQNNDFSTRDKERAAALYREKATLSANQLPPLSPDQYQREEAGPRQQPRRPKSIRFADTIAGRQYEGESRYDCETPGGTIYRDAVSNFRANEAFAASPAGSLTSVKSNGSEKRFLRVSSSANSKGSGSTVPRSNTLLIPSGKGNRRKLDAKVFALSMELIEHVSKGRLELAEKKIKQGASPDYADYDKRTPLHLAASEGHVGLVRMLLEQGANPEVADRWGSKPYDDAVKNGFKEIAAILREYAEPDDEDTLGKEHHDGLELLEYCARGFEGLVRAKIKEGAKATFADYDRRTPLHLAASEGHVKIAEILLQNGADATFKDRFGSTPVDDAMKNGFLDMLAAMENKGVKIPGHIFDKSCTPEFQRNMRLIDVCATGKVGKVQKLLKEGADPTFGDYDLRTPLHLACAEGHLSIVRLLISAGADVSAEDRWSSTAFEEAAKYGHDAVLNYLEQNVNNSPVPSCS